MRLHRLEVTAFGPFAETATVDFDALSTAGLFLLSGATGAGKTSVLDAVCFALYGAVPGERNDAKRLRSDQADATTVPRVTLEATLAGRRFRIVRSPAWARPKKRGTGTTPQQAAVTISERVDGAWVPLSTRLEETGHLVTALVGMNLTQFTQVAMLPQGRFQAFLRASSEDRHQLLQQLFRTERFEQVERWLRDRRLALHHLSQDHERATDALLHRISETAGVPLPEAPDGPWSQGLADGARLATSRLTNALPAVIATEEAARTTLEAARTTEEHRGRFAAARAEHDLLLGRADEVAAQASRVDDALRARIVVPLRRAAVAARAAYDDAVRGCDRHRTVVAQLTGVEVDALEPERIDALLAAAVRDAARVRALAPREAERAGVSARLTNAQADRAEVVVALAALKTRCEEAPARLAELREWREAAATATARLPEARASVGAAETRLAAGRTLHRIRNDLVVAQLDLNEAVAVCLGLQEELVALQQARLDGMAAEIASSLAVGGSCPVCGSEHHPQLASAAPGAPDAHDEKTLRRRIADAEVVRLARAEHARDLGTQAAVVEQAAGTDDTELLAQALDDVREAAAATEARAAGLDELTSALERAEADALEAAQEHTERTARLAELDATLAALTESLTQITAELADALGDSADLASLLDHLDAVAAALGAVRDSAAAAESARRWLTDAENALEALAREAGFADAAAALDAVTADDAIESMRLAVETHHRRVATLTAVLDDPVYAAAGAVEPVDLDALAGAHRRAADALTAARTAQQREAARADRLAGLHTELEAALAAWAPVRAELGLVSGLAAFVEGKSPDNALQMRLSAYVLGYRLSQVVDAANARLATMSDQRYSLEHTGRRGAGERRGGLSLLVRDDWSGETRDPATLSGGETFVVSLALALGLADVITFEVGGAALDTLFVDEGFGSLDADTLDDVMDTLDSLRDGGRVVGVVSHVAEMRDRIPTQLVVTKARTGSTVRLRG
jgi:DNA repair protein SbcC/Rad50